MIFNYTTSVKGGNPQSNISLSLGGYKSSSIVKNDDLNNLFDEISLYGMSEGKTEYRGIMFTNNTPVPMNNVKLYVEKIGEPFCDFGLNVTSTVKDSEGNDWMERVPDIYSKPIMGDFKLLPTKEDPITIESIKPEEVIGIWIQRIINKTKVREEYDKVAVKSTEHPRRYVKVEKSTEEGYNIVMEWD